MVTFSDGKGTRKQRMEENKRELAELNERTRNITKMICDKELIVMDKTSSYYL